MNGKGRGPLQREIQKLCYIVVDEISMMHTWYWGKLCSLRQAFPHLRFILVGDFGQLDPVNDVVDEIQYEDNAALHYLVDGNRVILKQCRRSDTTFLIFARTCATVARLTCLNFKSRIIPTFLFATTTQLECRSMLSVKRSLIKARTRRTCHLLFQCRSRWIAHKTCTRLSGTRSPRA